jgi:hypothetical protein
MILPPSTTIGIQAQEINNGMFRSSSLKRVIIIAVGSLFLLQTATVTSQSILGAATLGAAFQAALNKAGDLIRQAREAGDDLLLATGVEIQNAIISAQIAYESSLNKTKEAYDDSEKKTVTDIDNILQTAIQKGAHAAHDLLGQTQLIANSLPFATKIPQVGGYAPHFLLPGGDTIGLQVSGNFPFGFDTKNAPFITVPLSGGDTKKVDAASYGTTFMSFNIPKSLCGTPTKTEVKPCSVSLIVPWDASRWYSVFGRSIKQGTFRLEFGVLPATPGRFQLTHLAPGPPQHEENPARASDVFTFDSSDSDIEDNRALRLTADEIAAGWRIKPNTAHFDLVRHIEGVEGHDWYNMGYQNGSDVEVIWRARTERKHIGSSGKIQWRIVCTIQRNVPVTVNVPEEIPPVWSMSRTFDYPAGKWKLIWTRFDGAVHEFNSTDVNSNFVKVNASGDSLRLSTYGQF